MNRHTFSMRCGAAFPVAVIQLCACSVPFRIEGFFTLEFHWFALINQHFRVIAAWMPSLHRAISFLTDRFPLPNVLKPSVSYAIQLPHWQWRFTSEHNQRKNELAKNSHRLDLFYLRSLHNAQRPQFNLRRTIKKKKKKCQPIRIA